MAREPGRSISIYVKGLDCSSADAESLIYILTYPAFCISIESLRHGDKIRINITRKGTEYRLQAIIYVVSSIYYRGKRIRGREEIGRT